jgi:hypothetical protein
MKRFISIILILLASSVFANDDKIIEIHKNKSLDQLVLESNIIEEDNQEEKANQNDNTLQDSEISESEIDLDNQEDKINQTNEENENLITTDEKVTVFYTETIFDISELILDKQLNSIENIQSNTLNREFIKILSNIQFGNEDISYNIIYYLVKKLYEIGELEKAYNLVKKINKNNIINKINLNYFYFIELNYLYSSYNLSEVCNLKSILIEKSIKLPKNLLEKTDIFCLTLENKYDEAMLLNSLLLESEKNTDQNFQALFNYMILKDQINNTFNTSNDLKSKDLIFLYSAMLRINELPLNEDFIEIDPLNLAIPVILSESTKMNTRIKAANEAYYHDVLSITSLSALYQSVDFNSNQFANPDKTIDSLDNNELIMAYYYQLSNIQIFPDERLKVILKYWEFAKKIGLEKIAYAITKQMINTFSPSSENSEFAMQIAFAHISNKNYDEAQKWISLFDISNSSDNSFEYARFLINLNKNDSLTTIINYLSDNYYNFNSINDQSSLESINVLMKYLNIENNTETKLLYKNIEDTRLMPSYFLMEDIKLNINAKNNLSIFILSLISLHNKSWIELHPEHLRLILNAYSSYDSGILMKQIILEILNELKIF